MKMKVHSVEKQVQNDEVWWRVRCDVEEVGPGEPTTHYFHFPDSVFEWRAAEYGFDNAEEILDVVLAEPFLDAHAVPALFQFEITEEARQEHVARCVAGKLRTRLSTRGIENPLEMIRFERTLDPASVKAKKASVRESKGPTKITGRKDRG